MNTATIRVASFILALCLFALPAQAAPLQVTVSIVPQQYLVKKIGKDMVESSVMVLPGASPATYEPKPGQMKKIAQSTLYFAIGVPFESAWLPRIAAANPAMKVIHMEESIHLMPMVPHHHGHGHGHGHGHKHDHEGCTHEHHDHGHKHDHKECTHEHHGKDGHEAHEHAHAPHAGPCTHDHGHKHAHKEGKHEHAHKGHVCACARHVDGKILDPHVWTAPEEMKQMAATTLKALQEADPANAKAYQSNYEAFILEVDALDKDIHAILDPLPRPARFMVYHPAWGYFAHHYNLVQIPVEIEGKEPAPKELAALINTAKKNDIRVIFVQPQFSRRSAEVIANAIDGQVLPANPLAADWAENMRAVAKAFKAAAK